MILWKHVWGSLVELARFVFGMTLLMGAVLCMKLIWESF